MHRALHIQGKRRKYRYVFPHNDLVIQQHLCFTWLVCSFPFIFTKGCIWHHVSRWAKWKSRLLIHWCWTLQYIIRGITQKLASHQEHGSRAGHPGGFQSSTLSTCKLEIPCLQMHNKGFDTKGAANKRFSSHPAVEPVWNLKSFL